MRVSTDTGYRDAYEHNEVIKVLNVTKIVVVSFYKRKKCQFWTLRGHFPQKVHSISSHQGIPVLHYPPTAFHGTQQQI